MTHEQEQDNLRAPIISSVRLNFTGGEPLELSDLSEEQVFYIYNWVKGNTHPIFEIQLDDTTLFINREKITFIELMNP